MVNPALSEGLPPFLAPGAGLNSGFMMPQVTAAALVSENKGIRTRRRWIPSPRRATKKTSFPWA